MRNRVTKVRKMYQFTFDTYV